MEDRSSNNNRVKRELPETPEKLRSAGCHKVSPEKKRSCGRNLIDDEEIIELPETPEKQRNAGRDKVAPEKKRFCGRNLIDEEEIIDLVDSDEEVFQEFASTLDSGEISLEFDSLEDDQRTVLPEICGDHDASGGMLHDDPPIYKRIALSFEEVSVVLLDPPQVPNRNIGHTVPSGLYVGDALYVIDLRSLNHPKDILADRLWSLRQLIFLSSWICFRR